MGGGLGRRLTRRLDLISSIEAFELAQDGLDLRLRTDGLAGLVRKSGIDARTGGSPRRSRFACPSPSGSGGRKLVITPDGETRCPRPRIDSALVKALARAHRWQRMLESGECGSITELAAAEKIDRSYLAACSG